MEDALQVFNSIKVDLSAQITELTQLKKEAEIQDEELDFEGNESGFQESSQFGGDRNNRGNEFATCENTFSHVHVCMCVITYMYACA